MIFFLTHPDPRAPHILRGFFLFKSTKLTTIATTILMSIRIDDLESPTLSPRISATPTITMGTMPSSTILTLRTSNRYKKLIKERKNITDVFTEPDVTIETDESNTEPDSPIVSITKSNTNLIIRSNPRESCSSLSPLSIYTTDDELIEPTKLSQVQAVLDTGSDEHKELSPVIETSKRSNTISRFFYKILSNSSSNTTTPNVKPTVKSPYLKLELNDHIDDLIYRIEQIDNTNPNHYTGCLIIHCKMLKTIFERNNVRPYIVKRYDDSMNTNAVNLECWKVSINSIEMFVDGLEKGLVSINNIKLEKKIEKIPEPKVAITIPDKYKLSVKKELYSYQDDKQSEDELDVFLKELNNKLKLSNDLIL